MRSLFASLVACAVVTGAAAAAKVEVKGPHLCCKQCVRVATGLLEKVDGVSDVVADTKTKTVNFTAKDESAAKAGVKALVDGGFYGVATIDGKEVATGAPAAQTGTKADTVTIKDVHVCCNQCQTAINKLFADSKVTYDGKGAQRSVTIAGNNLDSGAVLEALRKSGFNGTPAK